MPSSFQSLALLFAGSILVSLVLTRFARGLGLRIGLVDRPDGRRKIHVRIVPLVGGIAVLGSSFFVLAAAWAAGMMSDLSDSDARELVGLALGSLLICAVGVLDDYRRLRGRYKLCGQLAAVVIVIASGLQVHAISLFGWNIELGWLSWPFTLFFLLGAVNSLNLLDGMDGLLGVIGLIICLALSAMAAAHGHVLGACIAVVLAGALVGFLRFNLPPASVFLGDAGSMFVGLAIGALAIRCSLKGPATVALAVPAALLVLPILDTGAALLRRKLTGRSVFATDRGHLHHCLLRCGLSTRSILLLVSGLCSLTVLGALGSVAYQDESLAILSALTVVFILLATRLFGCAEVLLLVKSVHDFTGRMIGMHRSGRELEVRLQGSAQWSGVWKRLVASAKRLNLQSISLDVNSPAHHEGYHARWSMPADTFGEEASRWSAVILLTAWGQTIGQVSVIGRQDAEPVWQKLAALAAVTDGVEAVLSAHESKPSEPLVVGTISA